MSTESENTKPAWQDIVPTGDVNSPHIELSDSRILVSGRFALILIEEDHVGNVVRNPKRAMERRKAGTSRDLG